MTTERSAFVFKSGISEQVKSDKNKRKVLHAAEHKYHEITKDDKKCKSIVVELPEMAFQRLQILKFSVRACSEWAPLEHAPLVLICSDNNISLLPNVPLKFMHRSPLN